MDPERQPLQLIDRADRRRYRRAAHGGCTLGPYTRETIENWVSDYCGSDRIEQFDGAAREYAVQILTTFLLDACAARNIEPAEIEEADAKAGLLGQLARLRLPESAKPRVPDLCADLLVALEEAGRLGGGRVLAAYVKALTRSYRDAETGRPAPFVNPGSKLGRNDPCPCGSGEKYKKCCMRK